MNASARTIFTIAMVALPIWAAVRLNGDYYSWWVVVAALVGMASTVARQGGELFALVFSVAGIILLIMSFAR